MRIGIVGLGRMGTSMGLRLLDSGFSLAVWNRTAFRAAALVEAGAVLAATPRALAESVDLVITVMFDATGLDAVFHSPDGLLSADLSGRLVMEMSTVRSSLERKLAQAVQARGGAFIDCPVGGTVGPARSGQLIGLAGGDAADLARARPVLEKLCRRIEHCGPVGAGAAMKLAINLPLAVSWQALGEALSLVRHLGRDPAWLMELFADTSGATTALKGRASVVAESLAGGDGGAASFDLGGVAKDLRAMVAEGESHGIPLPAARGALTAYEAADASGLGARDVSWMPAFWGSRPAPAELTLASASAIIDAALAEGHALGLAPLTVAVLDAGGHLVAFKREDNSGLLRFDIAFGKAWGALGMGFGSRELFARAQGNPSFIGALTVASGGRVVPVPGGVLIRAAGGTLLGAVGISGDTSDQDEACALAGIAAVGFKGQTGATPPG